MFSCLNLNLLDIISDEKKDEISEKYSEPNHQNESSTQEEVIDFFLLV